MSDNIYEAYGDKEKYTKYTKQAWTRAGGFPVNKEEVYPEHKIAQEFDNYHGQLVLEYGCGGGSDAISYLKRGNSVVLVDIVPHNIEIAKKNVGSLASAADFHLLEDSHILPFEDGQFDVVNSHGVLHHVVDVLPVVEQLYRVTVSGGYGYFMLYTEFLFEKAQSSMKTWMEEKGISWQEAFCWFTDSINSPYAIPYNEKEGIALFESVGYKIVDCYVYNNLDFRRFKVQKVK